MSDNGVIIVTASNADYKIINRLLTTLQHTNEFDETQWIVRNSKDCSTWTFNDEATAISRSESSPPNDWAGMSIEDVQAVKKEVCKQDRPYSRILVPWSQCFLILDDKGVETETVVFLDSATNETDSEEERRGPSPPAHESLCNKACVPWLRANEAFELLNGAHCHFLEVFDYPNSEQGEELVGEVGDRWFVMQDNPDRDILTWLKQTVDEEIEELRSQELA